ncbi:MAG TPA: hypothetical protein VEU47_14615 [Candidatus Cybelea sp.]|nr:hypothetical protein [Candidatus Cybelea sp.]
MAVAAPAAIVVSAPATAAPKPAAKPAPVPRPAPAARPAVKPAAAPATKAPPKPKPLAIPSHLDRSRIYVQKIETIAHMAVWIVDGAYIRGHIDEEFTNFGQHYRYPYIPLNELWLDKWTRPNEQRFFIDHLLVEHRLMAKGASYAEAIEAGDREERKERRRAGDVRRMTETGKRIPVGQDVHQRLWKHLENGVSVWIINGRLVRSVFDVDFTAGGHDYVYEFVPENEIWIDDQIVEQERGYVLLHELHERSLMAQGWPYSRAHADSSRLEYRCRHHPDELHDALAAEGWA